MISIIEYLQKNKEAIKDENKMFDEFQITGVGAKCLKITNIHNGSDEFISWDEFDNKDCHFIVNDIRNYYQEKVNEINEKEIAEAIEFIQKDEARIECLKKAIAGDKSFKESPVFDELMDEYLCNFAGASRVAKLAIARLDEDDNDDEVATATPSSSEVEIETKENKEKIDEKTRIKMENHLSQIFEQDVKIVLEEFQGTRKPDHTMEINGVEFNIYNTGACVLFAYPKNPEAFQHEDEFKLNTRCIETLEYIKEHGNQDGFHQYELQMLDENGYIRFDFPSFRYILTEKGKEALASASSSTKNKEGENMTKNDKYDVIAKYNKENGKIKKGDTIYGTTSTIDFNSITGDFESCDSSVTCRVKEINNDFTDYEQNRSRTGGQYGYYEWEVLEVLN